MEKVLEDFFLKKGLMNVESEDSIPINEWVKKASLRAGQVRMATHNGKFTHSGVGKEVSCIASFKGRRVDGYCRTGNCTTTNIDTLGKMDCLGNAAALDVYSFLSLSLTDGKTVFEHFETRSEYLRTELRLESLDYEEICRNMLSIRPDGQSGKTSDLLKQVYFPVEDGYHLLSILSSSCLMTESKKRIDSIRFSQEAKEGREARRNNSAHAGYEEIFNLTEIAYGGTKAQNIGVLNNQNRGISYLLASIPPLLVDRNVRFPRMNFFNTCLWKKDYEDLFKNLYRIFSIEYNNSNIRNARERIFQSIIDKIIQESWTVRSADGGWSAKEYYSNLPDYQKIWLDASREEDRMNSSEWQEKVMQDIARWICTYPVKPAIQSDLILGDDAYRYIMTLLEDSREAL